MPTIQELRNKANELKNKEDFENALPLLLEIWDKEKTDWNGFYLAQCLRKTCNYSEARQLHLYIRTNYPNFKPILNEELWLDYSEKIKDWENSDILRDAESLLLRTNKYDKYTGSIFNKTVLSVVKHLIYNKSYSTALTWLDKLDFSVLSNIPFIYKGQKYASEQKAFFVHYADVLVKLNKHIYYIESCLTCLGIEGTKQMQFKKYIIETITYQDYHGDNQITRLRLALYLKYFKEEIRNRSINLFSNKFNPNKITLISDLNDFEFCPVSFAINETYAISSNVSWEKDEWLGDKKHLIDRYNDFQRTKNYTETFKDSSIDINDTVKNDFDEIFNSKIIINNYDGSSSKFYSNPTDTVRGNPDYVFENTNKSRFAVVEKFTKRTSEEIATAFNNDLIKLYGYIFELTSLNIDFGYLIYWYWQLEDIVDGNRNIKKKIRIRTYRIFKVEKTTENKSKLMSILNKVNEFKRTGKLEVDGDKISYPNKCLNCSVVSYCNHKTGKFNTIKLPYDISEVTLNGLPSVNLQTQTENNNKITPKNTIIYSKENEIQDLLLELENTAKKLYDLELSLLERLDNDEQEANEILDKGLENSERIFRRIGERLNALGGFDLMQSVFYQVSKKHSSYSVISSSWNNIGEWLN
jgi:hypothetical protein